jgi:hypothetical protein
MATHASRPRLRRVASRLRAPQGVRPAWALAQDLLVPAQGVQVAPTYGLVCVPYPRDVLYKAPRQPAGLPLTPERAREAYLNKLTDCLRLRLPLQSPGTLPARSDDLQVGIDPHDGVEAGVRRTW